MKGLKKSKYLMLATCAVALTSFAGNAQAQTANMTATATVLNTLTLATPAQLNFGTIAAIRDPALTASVTVGTDGTPGIASGGGLAVTALIDTGTVSAGQVTIADGANTATINININAVVDPVNGGESFVLDGFTTSYNNAADQLQVINTPFTETFDSAFGGGTNTLDIGATITTTLGAGTAYTDGAYAGTYNVVFSY